MRSVLVDISHFQGMYVSMYIYEVCLAYTISYLNNMESTDILPERITRNKDSNNEGYTDNRMRKRQKVTF